MRQIPTRFMLKSYLQPVDSKTDNEYFESKGSTRLDRIALLKWTRSPAKWQEFAKSLQSLPNSFTNQVFSSGREERVASLNDPLLAEQMTTAT